MELDDPFADELGKRRAEVDERQQQLREALHQLRLAGRSALEELRAAGHSSAMIAIATGLNGSTIRKLNSDGDKSGWRQLSRESYAALDAYIGSRLGRSADLAGLRHALDAARRDLQEAERRLDETQARSDRPVPPFDLGIMFIPGLPERRVDRSLRQFGDTLAGSFAKDRDGDRRRASVRVANAQLTPGKEPAHLVLQPDRLEGGDGAAGSGHRWLVAVTPVSHGLVDDQDLRDFLRWLLAALPFSAADVLDRRQAQARCVPGARLRRWSCVVRNAVTGLVGIPLLLLAMVFVLACLAALLLPATRTAGRAGAGLLSRGFGLSFALGRGQATLDAQVNQAAKDLAWLRLRCRMVAVVAQGHGVPVADGLVRRAPGGMVQLLVTLGSPLRRFWFAQALEGHPEHTFGGIGGLLAWFWASLFLLSWFGLAALVGLLAMGGDDPPGAVLAVVGTALFGVMIVWFAGWSRRVLRTEVLPVRLRALAGPRRRSASPPWLDLASAADPMADGPYLAAAAPLGEVHAEVRHQASVWADHRAYLKPGSEALHRLLAELARMAPPPGEVAAVPPGGAVRRVRWLITARRVAVVSGLVAATVLLPRMPTSATRGGSGVAVLLLLWTAGGVVAYVLLKSCWRMWDYAQRGYELAVAAGEAATEVPIWTAFSLLLELLVLAVTWPVLLALGWWSALLRGAVAMAVRFDGGDPGRRPTALVIELALGILVVFGLTVALGLLLSRPSVRRLFERRHHHPDPVAVASLLLRRLPEGGLDVGGSRYCAVPISWDVAVPGLWRRGEPRPCSAPARMLLRDDTIVLDLREGCVLGGWVAHVHGRRLRWAGPPPPGVAADRPRLARHQDWRAFRRDLPELLRRVSSEPH